MRPGSSNPKEDAGRHLRQLAHATIAALQDAGLADEIALLDKRVFSRAPTDLFETDGHPDDGLVRFKPMIELLLRHMQEAAVTAGRSADQRRREIHWALEIAGF